MSRGDSAPPSAGARSWLRNLVRATITTPVFFVTHLVRSHRIERSVEHVAEFSEPTPRPASIAERGVQSALDGAGPIVMRAYSIVIEHPASSSAQLIDLLVADPNTLNAWAVAG